MAIAALSICLAATTSGHTNISSFSFILSVHLSRWSWSGVLATFALGLMAIPNLIALLLLSPQIVTMTKRLF
jgi:Na+/alanine symporter